MGRWPCSSAHVRSVAAVASPAELSSCSRHGMVRKAGDTWPPAPWQTSWPVTDLGDALTYLWARAGKGRCLSPLSQWDKERSKCIPALAAGITATFWSSISSASPSPHVRCLSHSLLPGRFKVNSTVFAKDPCNQTVVLRRLRRVTSEMIEASSGIVGQVLAACTLPFRCSVLTV